MAYQNSTVYGKYIKVKSGGQSGVKRSIEYVKDKNKTTQNGEIENSDVSNALHYAANRNKTVLAEPSVAGMINDVTDSEEAVIDQSGRKLVSGLNCDPDHAPEEFAMIEQLYHMGHDEHLQAGHTANMAFHTILSFKGHDLDPEFVHQLGVEFARRMYGDEYQAVVCTHLNTDNYHNHIVSNAYSIDGTHKFKDAYYLYKDIRKIANEISLEYGLPVFVNQDREENGPTAFKSWKEFLETEEGKSWKAAICNDLNHAISSSTSYDEVMKKMKEYGYTIQQNKRSVTFKKDKIKVRDIKLGQEYTKEGIEQTYQRIKEREDKERLKELLEQRKKVKQNHQYESVYIPLYDDYGQRRSLLLRLILTIIELIKQAMDDAYNAYAAALMPDNPIAMDAKKKLDLLEKCVKLVKEYDVKSTTELDIILREQYAKKNQYGQILDSLKEYAADAEPIINQIKEIEGLDPILFKYNIEPSDLTSPVDQREINRNLAALNPMTSKTKSALYQILHNSEYRLLRKFDEISQADANAIIQAITEKRTENLPDYLCYGERKYRHKPETQETQKPINLSDIPEDDRKSILQAKEIMDNLAKYGILTLEDGKKFVLEYDKKVESQEPIRDESARIAANIKELYWLKRNLEIIQNPDFVYGMEYNGSGKELQESVHRILPTKVELIQALIDRKKTLPNLTDEQVAILTLPNPAEYRYMIHCVSAGIINKPITNPKKLHDFINEMRYEFALEQALEAEKKAEKEAEKIQKERHHVHR